MTGLIAQATVKGPPINWEALSPAIALTVGACVVLLVGLARSSFIRRNVVPGADDRDARRHRRARRLAVGHQRGDHRQGAGRRQPDARADDDLRRRRDRRRAAVLALGGERRGRRGRVLRAAADLDPRHAGAGRGQRPGRAVHRLRAALDPAVRALRDAHEARAVAGVGPEVPDHRLGRLGDAAVRPGAAVRRRGRHELRRARRRGPRHRRRRAVPDRHRAGHGRAGLQGLGRAVPPVDAGRLRGRADAGHRLHGGGDQGGRVRRASCGSSTSR